MRTKIKQKLRQETVLIIAVLLAVFSAFIIPPDARGRLSLKSQKMIHSDLLIKDNT